jgi:hypothetical protein
MLLLDTVYKKICQTLEPAINSTVLPYKKNILPFIFHHKGAADTQMGNYRLKIR